MSFSTVSIVSKSVHIFQRYKLHILEAYHWNHPLAQVVDVFWLREAILTYLLFSVCCSTPKNKLFISDSDANSWSHLNGNLCWIRLNSDNFFISQERLCSFCTIVHYIKETHSNSGQRIGQLWKLGRGKNKLLSCVPLSVSFHN